MGYITDQAHSYVGHRRPRTYTGTASRTPIFLPGFRTTPCNPQVNLQSMCKAIAKKDWAHAGRRKHFRLGMQALTAGSLCLFNTRAAAVLPQASTVPLRHIKVSLHSIF